MKTRLTCILLCALLLLLCACTQVQPVTERPAQKTEVTEQSVSELPATTEAPELKLIPKYNAFGSDGKLITLDNTQLDILTEQETTEALAAYPTLNDAYPADFSGLLFEVTPEMIAHQIALGQDFLAYYYNTSPTDYNFELREDVADYVVWLESDELDAAVNPWRVDVTLNAPYTGELTSEAIASQPLVRAAMEWKDISEPEVREKVELGLDGQPYCRYYTFAAHSDDPVEQLMNLSFQAVEVAVYYSGLMNVRINEMEPTIAEGETAAISGAQLSAFLAETYPDNPPTEYVTEVFYSSKVQSGKYIPCYRIYLLEPDLTAADGSAVYSVIEATTAEISAASVTDVEAPTELDIDAELPTEPAAPATEAENEDA